MGGSISKSDSEADSSSQFSQDVWAPQGDALSSLYQQAGDLFGQTNAGMQSQIPGAVDSMQGVFNQADPAYQQQLQGGAYAGMDLQGDYNRALSQGGGNEQFIDQSIMGGAGNDYADAMKGQIMQQAGDLQNQMLQGTDARAAAAGMSGGSRHGTAQAQGMENINRDAQNAMTNVGYNTFDKDLDRKLGIAQRADTYDMNKLNMAGGMLGQQQNAMSGAIDQGSQMQNLGMGQFAPYMAPWEAAGSYSNAIGAPTVLGAGTSSAESDSSSFGASGGVGGK